MSSLTLRWNRKHHSILQTDKRFVVTYGGAGSGKSVSVAQKIVSEICSGARYLVVRKVAKTLRQSVFALLRQVIAESGIDLSLFRINRTEMTITFLPSGGEVITAGLDDVEKLKSIVGIDRVWVEEASEITEDDFKQLNLRLRGKTKFSHQLLMSFNPIDHTHWAKAFFFDEPKENAFVLHSTYKDNAFLDAEYKAELERLKDIDWYYYTVYALGNWGTIGNLVFSNYVIEDFDYDATNLERLCDGMDFGFNHASTLVSFGFKDGELYVYDEHYYKGKTNPEFIESVREAGFPKGRLIRADSAEPARIKEWQKAGFRVEPARKGRDSLMMGIDWLKSQRVHIHKSRCPNTAREMQTAKYEEDKDGNVLDKIVEVNDDCIAGLRYGSEHIWASTRPEGTAEAMKRLAGLMG